MTEWISTKEAMQMLGVGPTTIKRWANEGLLPNTRTAGGHRRFRTNAVKRLLRQQPITGKDSQIDEWIDLLIEEGDVMKIRDRIIQLRDQSGDWYRAADYLDNVMMKIWSDGSTEGESNAQSHIAAGRLGLALSSISKSHDVEPGAPIVLVATFGGPQLSHRLALTELCIRSEGMEVLRTPQKTSTTEMTTQIKSWDQSLVVLAAADQCTDCDLLDSAYRTIAATCKKQGVELAKSFGGNLPDNVDYGHCCESFADLKNVLQQQLKLNSEAASVD